VRLLDWIFGPKDIDQRCDLKEAHTGHVWYTEGEPDNAYGFRLEQWYCPGRTASQVSYQVVLTFSDNRARTEFLERLERFQQVSYSDAVGQETDDASLHLTSMMEPDLLIGVAKCDT
jgi:hypothetical protein